jgi:hypothetical protein
VSFKAVYTSRRKALLQIPPPPSVSRFFSVSVYEREILFLFVKEKKRLAVSWQTKERNVSGLENRKNLETYH